MPFIYKYFGSDVFKNVFEKEGVCQIKCSLPSEYNDPYELFLAMDLTVGAEALAFYEDVVSKLPQLPTSCFSFSPIITPMWAHYAKNHSGFVVEYDLEKLQDHFPETIFHKVNYRDTPRKELGEALIRASVTTKPRHTHWLRQAAFTDAYFTKYSQWQYEQEFRLVDATHKSVDIENHKILRVPIECVNSIIVGTNAPAEIVQASQLEAKNNDLNWYKLKIGRSHPQPYFSDTENNSHEFSDGRIQEASFVCDTCSEPLTEDGELCPWCNIDDAHRHVAAMSNPFRLLDAAGLLDNYLEMAKKIDSGTD